MDAFSRPFPSHHRIFANPPFILIPKLLSKVMREKAQLVLLAPRMALSTLVARSDWDADVPTTALPGPGPLPPTTGPLSLLSPSLPPKWDTIACSVSGRL